MNSQYIAALAVLIFVVAAFVDTVTGPATALTWLQRLLHLIAVCFLAGALSACGGTDDTQPALDTPAPRPPACGASGACT